MNHKEPGHGKHAGKLFLDNFDFTLFLTRPSIYLKLRKALAFSVQLLNGLCKKFPQFLRKHTIFIFCVKSKEELKFVDSLVAIMDHLVIVPYVNRVN